MTEAITGLVSALGSLVTGLFSVSGEGAAISGIGLLTGAVLAVGLLRKGAGKSKKVIGG